MTAHTTALIERAQLNAEGMLQRAQRVRELAERLMPVHALIGNDLKEVAASMAYRAGELQAAVRLAQENPHSTGPFTVSTTATRPGIVARVLTADGDTLCEVLDAGPHKMSISEARGNADHIATCLNAHDDLVAALKDARAALERHFQPHGRLMMKIDAAVSKAAGGAS